MLKFDKKYKTPLLIFIVPQALEESTKRKLYESVYEEPQKALS